MIIIIRFYHLKILNELKSMKRLFVMIIIIKLVHYKILNELKSMNK